MNAIQAIMTRRSTRRMRADLPPQAMIEKILEAGRAAPSGSNSQTTHLIVITRQDVLSELAVMVQEAFAAMETGPETYVSLRHAVSAAKKGGYVFHYGAPVLIVTANRKSYGNALADSACVLENMMIAANALDLGACWINQLHWLDGDERIRAYLEHLGLGAEETITGGLILGYGADGQPVRDGLVRAGNPVTWVCGPEQERENRQDAGGDIKMKNAKEYCTCTDTKFPCHPVNHDQGCNLCIQKNLRQKEIPSCFFHDIDCEKPTAEWHYGDFSALVEKARAEGKL